jgi:peptidyl-prolyl cis-trans isomerase D
MLDSFRKASQTWFVKILFAVLILSFSAWGVGDVIRGRVASQPAIVVGNEKIGISDVADEFRRDTERLSAMSGGKLTADQARQFGLLQRTIQQIISRSLLDQAVGDLGLTVDDETMRKVIASTPAFQNELHVFDRMLYQRQLARAGYTERRFVAIEREDIARQELTRLVAGGAEVPRALADPLYRYEQELRVAETITFAADKMPAPPKPDESVLRQFHTDHSAQFMSPEMRGVSLILLRNEDVAATIKPSEQDIAKSYQVRQAEFEAPGKRTVQQALFSDQAKAQEFADKVKAGGDFGANAKSAGVPVADLGSIERKDMPIPTLADAVFGTAAPGVVGPVQTPLGWHVFRIVSVTPAKIRPLAEVRDQISHDLAKDEATNRLYTLSTKLEDAIGSGAGLDEAASTLNVKLIKMAAMDAHGNGPDGKPAAGFTLPPDILAAAFKLGQGATSEVTQLGENGSSFVLHVDSVSPPALKPFDTVKDQVLAAWSQEQREKAARQLAERAVERLKNGESLAAVAGSSKMETTQPFRRTAEDAVGVPPLLAAEMFKQSQPGGIALVAVPGGTLVARLKSIIPADLKAQPGQYDRLKQQLEQAVTGDLMREYLAALETTYGVRVNASVINQQFEK